MANRSGWIICGLLALALSGCDILDKDQTPSMTPKPTPIANPIESVQSYVTMWEKKDFAGMYALLTPSAKQAMTEAQFAERYEKIYEGIEAANLTVTEPPALSPEANGTPGASATGPSGDSESPERTFEYRVRMDTAAGPLEYVQEGRLKKTPQGDGERWLIDWKPSLLFPGMAEGDKVRVQTVASERGEIVDRNGIGLAVNGSAPELGIVPGQLGESPDTAKEAIADKLGITAAEIDRKLGASWVKPDQFVPIAIVAEGAMADYENLPGVAFQTKLLREYPFGEAAAHLTGYVGPITAEELAKRKDQGYKASDEIGKAGLEQILEDRLRGKDGIRILIADSGGKRKSILAEKEAVPGRTIQLAIDSKLQETIYAEVRGDEATVAAVQPQTGEILALLSSPSYDPNAFVRGISKERFDAWNGDPRHPFLNRFSKTYAPGSAFKIVTAAIGMDTGKLDPTEARKIQGLTWMKDASWGNYYVKRVHAESPVDLAKALIYSDNIYFAQTAIEVGGELFAAEAAKLGIGEDLPIDYPMGRSRLANEGVPNGVLLADSGYGQGQVTMTSLHVALAFSAVANGGDIAYPLLVLDEEEAPPLLWKEKAMLPETAAILRDALVKAVSDPAGVGHGAYIPGAAVAGKTGTAELKSSKDAEAQENGWFVGFDANDPELLLSVMIEKVKGRGGSRYVAPIVKRIFLQAGKE